jgi:predicted ATPase
MNNRKENFYVITGGPGVGKSTLLDVLNKRGFKTVPEDAREIIKHQMEIGGNGLPWKNTKLYTNLMLSASLKSYKSIQNAAEIHFFDRGILDTLCYADMINLEISAEMNEIAKNNLYNQKVFILPPWLEIYKTDNERKQTWEEAEFTFTKMKQTYIKYGYEIIEIPKDTVENRADFILEHLK